MRYESIPGVGLVELIEPDYLALFEERLQKLQPYPVVKRGHNELGTEQIKLYPEKLVSAILWRHNDEFDILLPEHKTESGYIEQEHTWILNENNIACELYKTFMSFVIVSGGERYMVVDGLDNIKYKEEEKLRNVFQRYGIKTAFASDSSWNGYALRNDADDAISFPDYQETLDQLVYDDLTRQIAETYGCSVSDWLRYRATRELPEGSKPVVHYEMKNFGD